MSIAAAFRRMRTAAQTATRSAEPLTRLQKLTKAELNHHIMRANQALIPHIRSMLRANLAASGLKRNTGTMQKAFEGAMFSVGPRGIQVTLPPGLEYPQGKEGGSRGNPYAAAGVYTFGGIHQPRTETGYRDLPTREQRGKTSKYGVFGAAAKRSAKRVLSKGGHLTEKESTSGGRFKLGGKGGRLKMEKKGGALNLLRAVAAGTASYVPARAPFFRLSPGQQEQLEALRIEYLKSIAPQYGIVA